MKPAAVMINLLGASDGPALPSGIKEALQDPDAHLHIYGKQESRKGRKMGHLTLIGDDLPKTTSSAKNMADHIQFGTSS